MFAGSGTISAGRVKLVVDINVLISSLMGGELASISSVLTDARFQVVTTNEQLAELLDVMERSKFRKYFTLADPAEVQLEIAHESDRAAR